jgi:hypothetical protein
MMTQDVKVKEREKGQGLVEFAVSLVILMLILAGILDLGRMFFQYIAMRDAAQEGAVFGIVYPTHCDQIVDRTLNVLTDPAGIVVAVDVDTGTCTSAVAANACSGKEVRVTVTDPDFPISMPFLGAFVGQSLNLEASVSGTILRPPCP